MAADRTLLAHCVHLFVRASLYIDAANWTLQELGDVFEFSLANLYIDADRLP
jgi:hypothetical protein